VLLFFGSCSYFLKKEEIIETLCLQQVTFSA